jgi:two-component system copper resistance phosphate regulon response regulator CusR
MRILIVEDEADVARFLIRGLTEEAYAVDHATDGNSALDMAAVNTYDAVVLDITIPEPDGMEVCRRLRAGANTVPILMLTARDTVDDKINGLDAGADDYLTKPFQFREFLARLRALLRRGGATTHSTLNVGSLELDTKSHRVRIANHALTLTTKEYSLLEYLARNSGRIVTREEIAEHVWNESFDPFSNLIEVYINRLRRQMEKASNEQFIVTVRGAGYMLDAAGNPGG